MERRFFWHDVFQFYKNANAFNDAQIDLLERRFLCCSNVSLPQHGGELPASLFERWVKVARQLPRGARPSSRFLKKPLKTIPFGNMPPFRLTIR